METDESDIEKGEYFEAVYEDEKLKDYYSESTIFSEVIPDEGEYHGE